MFNYPKVSKILKAFTKMEGDILVLFIWRGDISNINATSEEA